MNNDVMKAVEWLRKIDAGGGPGTNQAAALLEERERLRRAALGVANAIHVGTGALIGGTMMEDELRQALGLRRGELWNFTLDRAEASFPQSRGEK